MSGLSQPPSGGCVLKLKMNLSYQHMKHQPPSGGCVLKQAHRLSAVLFVAASRLRAAAC